MQKISIIIAAYNMEQYIEKCLNSCLNQTLSETEIIIIDDASTDNTANIINKYANKCSNIKVFFMNKNKRQGAARNIGILNSNAEYIFFLDADDWIEPDTCQKLYEAANGADMCGGDMFINTDTDEKIKKITYHSIFSPNEDEREFYLKNNGLFTSRIYRKDFLEKYKILFPENIFYEDLIFNTLCGFYFESVIKIEGAFYHYYQRANSSSHYHSKQQFNRREIAEKLYEECYNRGLNIKFKKIVDWKYLYTMSGNILYVCLPKTSGKCLEPLKHIRKSVKKIIPDYKRKLRYLDNEMSFFMRLTMFSPLLTVIVYKLNLYFYSKVLLTKLNKLLFSKND